MVDSGELSHFVCSMHGGMNFRKRTCLFEEGDKCLFPKTDIVVLLPHPRPLGGTVRWNEQYYFAFDFKKFKL